MANIAFSDAAHKYGFDNMPVHPTQGFVNASILGTLVSTTPSWVGDNPPLMQDTTLTSQFSNGFTQVTNVRFSSAYQATIKGIYIYKTETNELLYGVATDQFVSSANGFNLTPEQVYGGRDVIVGNSFDNKLKGFFGSDVIDGQGGLDTVYFSSHRASAYIQVNTGHPYTFVNSMDDGDFLLNIERLRFADKTVGLDINGHAGQAYRLYQAALNRTPDLGGLGVQINGLDGGMSIQQIAQNFMDSAEFKIKYGENLSNAGFVTQLYANVLHRAPDAEGFAHQVHALDIGFTRAQLLVNFSESPENYNATLVGIKNGVEFIHVAY